jgi:heme exporter protein B
LKQFILKEIRTEIRSQSAIAGLLIYICSAVFICYTALYVRAGSINAQTWSALFWIIILFSSFGIIGKSFMGERKGVLMYYHSLLSPTRLILAKIIYATVLMLFLSFAGLIIFFLLMGNPIQDNWIFLCGLLLGAAGFASALTLLAGIASKAGNNSVLMAVLGFPVVLSILLQCIQLTKNSIDGLGLDASLDELMMLGAIDSIAAAASYLLFPYIWRS